MSDFEQICKYKTLREARKYMANKTATFKEIKIACYYEKRSIIDFLYSDNAELIFTVIVQSIAVGNTKLFKYYFNKHVNDLTEDQIRRIFILAIESLDDIKIIISMAKKYRININEIEDINISISMIRTRDDINELCKKIKFRPDLSEILKSAIIGCNYELAIDLINEEITFEPDDEFNKVFADGIELSREYLQRAIKN